MKSMYYSVTILGTIEVDDNEVLTWERMQELAKEDLIHRVDGNILDTINDLEVEEVKK